MKIDTSKIEGYEQMSAEEKLQALEMYELDTTGYVKKDVFDKTSSEVATLKKQLKERMTQEEQDKIKATEEFENMKAELEALRKDKAIQEHTNQFLALGYEQDLAVKTAEALYNGDMKTVFNNQKAFQENLVKKERAELLKETPKPQSGGTEKVITREDFVKMSYEQKAELYSTNEELYNQLSKGE